MSRSVPALPVPAGDWVAVGGPKVGQQAGSSVSYSWLVSVIVSPVEQVSLTRALGSSASVPMEAPLWKKKFLWP